MGLFKSPWRSKVAAVAAFQSPEPPAEEPAAPPAPPRPPGRDAAADPLSPGDQESIDTLHGRHRRATVPRAMP